MPPAPPVLVNHNDHGSTTQHTTPLIIKYEYIRLLRNIIQNDVLFFEENKKINISQKWAGIVFDISQLEVGKSYNQYSYHNETPFRPQNVG